MINITRIEVLEEAIDDMESGLEYYDNHRFNLGDHFWFCLLNDIDLLHTTAGVHIQVAGFYRALSKHFPYAIFYRLIKTNVQVVAVLPMRRSPKWIMKKLENRK